jgi:hypothetical protein
MTAKALGTFRARAVNGDIGLTKDDKPQFGVVFKILEGPLQNQHVQWYGFLFGANPDQASKNKKRSFESMRFCGCTFPNDDPTDLTGLDQNEVELVLEEDEYEGTIRTKVAWVNAIGGGVRLAKQLDDAGKARFKSAFAGLALATKPPSDGKAPVGANGTQDAAKKAAEAAGDEIPF